MWGIGRESFFAINTGRIGSPARPSRKLQVKPMRVALYTCQKLVRPSVRENRIQRTARIAKQA
jgi:hypothetical protein